MIVASFLQGTTAFLDLQLEEPSLGLSVNKAVDVAVIPTVSQPGWLNSVTDAIYKPADVTTSLIIETNASTAEFSVKLGSSPSTLQLYAT